MLPLIGAADLESGDIVGVADALFCSSRWMPCNTPPTLRGLTLVRPRTVRALRSRACLTRGGSSNRATTLAGAKETIEPNPCF